MSCKKLKLSSNGKAVSWSLLTANGSPCNWTGITRDGDKKVAKIDLLDYNLGGNLNHFSFSSFPNLVYLTLKGNQLSGKILPRTDMLRNLTFFELSHNSLERFHTSRNWKAWKSCFFLSSQKQFHWSHPFMSEI